MPFASNDSEFQDLCCLRNRYRWEGHRCVLILSNSSSQVYFGCTREKSRRSNCPLPKPGKSRRRESIASASKGHSRICPRSILESQNIYGIYIFTSHRLVVESVTLARWRESMSSYRSVQGNIPLRKSEEE